VISETLKNRITEPLAVASGLKPQLFKALCSDDFIDHKRWLGRALNPLATVSGSVPWHCSSPGILFLIDQFLFS
jgi:hypothetical protein